MVAQRNFDTGGSGGGGITNPQKTAQRLGAFSNAADFVKRGLTGDTGGSGSSSTAGNYCPAGSTRVPGQNLCRWNHNGVEVRSEEHTSELQSREKLVCRLLL